MDFFKFSRASLIVAAVKATNKPATVVEAGETALSSPTMRQGQLLSHGAAPYENIQKNGPSYFVSIALANGTQQTIWGVGLEEAITRENPQIGEQIAITYKGSQPVVIYGEIKHRNNCQVERAAKGEQVAADAPRLTNAEIGVALESVRERTHLEAERETKQAAETARTYETPFEGGGDDHAYRTKAEAQAAQRADSAADAVPDRPMPTDLNQSKEIEHLAQEQSELLKQKQKQEQEQKAEARKSEKPRGQKI